MQTQWWAIVLVLICTIIGSFGPILIKIGSKKLNRASFAHIGAFIRSTLGNLPLVAGIGFYGIAFLVYLAALRGGDLSVIYPLVSLNYIWVSLLSVKILKEHMTGKKWVGVGLIILGAVLVGLGS